MRVQCVSPIKMAYFELGYLPLEVLSLDGEKVGLGKDTIHRTLL
jgi:hypothetical protein